MSERVLTALVVFVVLAALSLIVPKSLPGELAPGQMTPHAAAACAACPATEQLQSAGLTQDSDGWHLTLRFAAPPVNSRVQLAFEPVPGAAAIGSVDLRQTGSQWRSTGRSAARISTIGSREALVVLTLPADLPIAGVRVRTGSGDQLPADGYLQPVYPSSAAFGLTDGVLLLLLLGGAALGSRRGALAECANLAAVAIGLVLAVALFKPAAAAMLQVTPAPRAAAALASGLVILVTSVLSFLLVPRLMAPFRATRIDATLNGGLGFVAAGVRQLPLLAAVLVIATDLAVMHWAAPGINSSVIGSALLRAWRGIFTA